MKFNLQPEVIINYLGNQDQIRQTVLKECTFSPLYRDYIISPQMKRHYPFTIEFLIMNARLCINFKYSGNRYYRTTILDLIADISRYLEKALACTNL